VYTHHPERVTAPNTQTTSEDPTELVKRLEAEGVTGLAICGGANIYTLFMKAGLINDLYIVTEPILFGSGVTLFSEPIDTPIELFESTIRRGKSIVNHYKVLNES
jgi:dihydrofolate reductase